MRRIFLLIVALVAGLLTGTPPATADTGCPNPVAPAQDGSTYLISTAAEFQWIKDADEGGTDAQWGYTYRQTADIDFTGCTWTTTIGTSSFSGRYDGGGYAISNLTISAGSSGGVFAVVGSTGVLTNIHLRNVTSTTSGSNVGLLIDGLYGELSGASATGSISGGTNIGGLVGGVLGGGANVGVLQDSYASVTVTAGGANSGAGGLVGTLTNGALVRRSFATGSVTADFQLGGLVGSSVNSTVLDSYAAGAVSGISSNAGGLMGLAAGTTTIQRSYAVGAVSSAILSGGFIAGGFVVDNANFWDTQTSGQPTAGQSASASGKTTEEMTTYATFADAGWSITDGYSTSTTWGICARFNDGYPFLTAVQTTNVCAQPDPAQVPPSWYQSVGRDTATATCPDGWTPSWAEWPNGRAGGFVCNKEIYWDIDRNGWWSRSARL